MANGKRATVYFPHKKMVRTLPATWYFVTSNKQEWNTFHSSWEGWDAWLYLFHFHL